MKIFVKIHPKTTIFRDKKWQNVNDISIEQFYTIFFFNYSSFPALPSACFNIYRQRTERCSWFQLEISSIAMWRKILKVKIFLNHLLCCIRSGIFNCCKYMNVIEFQNWTSFLFDRYY